MRKGYFSASQMEAIGARRDRWGKDDSEAVANPAHLYATPDGESVVLVTTVSELDAVQCHFDDMVDLGPVGEWVASFRHSDAEPPRFPVILPRGLAPALLRGSVPASDLEVGRLLAESVATPVEPVSSPSP